MATINVSEISAALYLVLRPSGGSSIIWRTGFHKKESILIRLESTILNVTTRVYWRN